MSHEVFVTVEAGRLVPKAPADAEVLADLEGGVYRAVLTQPGKRSLSQLGLYFTMCEMLADNSDGPWTKDSVDHTLRLATGHWRPVMGGDGRLWQVPKSIAFNKLAPADFSAYLDRAFAQAATIFGHELSDAVQAELDRMMAGEPAGKGGAAAKNRRADCPA